MMEKKKIHGCWDNKQSLMTQKWLQKRIFLAILFVFRVIMDMGLCFGMYCYGFW